MSSQSYLFNPTERTLAAAGDGFSLPRLTTAGRNALTLTVSDGGMMVYDTTIQSICVWTGTTWSIIVPPATATILTGVVDPEGVVTAPPGSIYFNIAIAGAPVQFVKGSGSGNTGWV
jgi:hypothetical protein